ncbi:MAG: PEP-utilizing enzyme, partial [Tepidiformaceae bacterium]
HIHFSLLIPAFVGFSEFRDMFARLFPGGGELDAYRLLQGFDNKSLEADRAFWALSQKAAASPALLAVFESNSSDEIPTALATTPEGREFLRETSAVLAEFGRRSDTVQELGDPSWVEEPRPLFAHLKAVLEGSQDPHDRLAAMAAQREAALAQAREALSTHPSELRAQFEGLLGAAQHCSVLQEDHNYWIDQRVIHEVRQVCMEVGRRLTADAKLSHPDDVFMFTLPELRELASGTDSGVTTASQRRTEMAHWATITPPPMLGTDYGPPPDNPVARAMDRMFGGPPPAPEKTRIRGHAGSSGKVRGIARLILTIDDADRLGVGEILVAPTTSPPWTMLFASAAAVVTDTGGVLSHCAVVAREYHIPAVVGTGAAVAMIRDGQEIEVDGDAGVVTLL